MASPPKTNHSGDGGARGPTGRRPAIDWLGPRPGWVLLALVLAIAGLAGPLLQGGPAGGLDRPPRFSASWWWQPIDRAPLARLPRAGGRILDVMAVPGTGIVWAAGEGGLLLKSADHGRTWTRPCIAAGSIAITPLPAGPPAAMPEQMMPPDDVDDESAEADPKAGADARRPSAEHARPLAVPAAFVPGRTGSRAMLVRQDGAADEGGMLSWTDFTWPIERVHFRSAADGWIVADAGPQVLLWTRDGGATWTPTLAVAEGEPYGVTPERAVWKLEAAVGGEAAARGEAYRGSNGSLLEIVTDGALVRLAENQLAEGTGFDVWSVGASTFVRTPPGASGDTYQSIMRLNTARSSTERSSLVPDGAIPAMDAAVAWLDETTGAAIVPAADGRLTVLTTFDGGRAWNEHVTVDAPGDAPSVALAWADRSRLIAHVADGRDDQQTLLHEISLGSNRRVRTIRVDEVLPPIDVAATDEAAFTLGEDGNLLRIDFDAGRLEPVLRPRLAEVVRLDADSLAGRTGAGRIMVSDDGGRSWAMRDGPGGGRIRSIESGPRGELYALDDEGLARSGDGGDSWRRLPAAGEFMTGFFDVGTDGAVWAIADRRPSDAGWIGVGLMRWSAQTGAWTEAAVQPFNQSQDVILSLQARSLDQAMVVVQSRDDGEVSARRTSDGGNTWVFVSDGGAWSVVEQAMLQEPPPPPSPVGSFSRFRSFLGAATRDGVRFGYGDSARSDAGRPRVFVVEYEFFELDEAIRTIEAVAAARPAGLARPGRHRLTATGPVMLIDALGAGWRLDESGGADGDGPAWRRLGGTASGPLVGIIEGDGAALPTIAVAPDGFVHRSDDDGVTWGLIGPAGPSSLPAPWVWLVLAAALASVGMAFRPRPPAYAETPGIEAVPASDRPLEPGDPDPLGFGVVADAISRFLRNPATEAPLTIAVTGAWGSGKSSILKLLEGDLRTRGFRPVWFNAWHHQKEEHLLAALLEAVRGDAGLPPWTPACLVFRGRLLLARVQRHAVLASVVTLAGATALGYLLSGGNEAGSRLAVFVDAVGRALASDDPAATIAEEAADVGAWIGVPAALLVLLPALVSLLRGLQAFGVSPAALLASSTARPSRRDLQVQTSLRHRFALEFASVTRSLGNRRLVIMIDDLDRCRPANVLDVLEAVNFLVSSGRCFVVLGLAEQPVRDAIAFVYRDMLAHAEAGRGDDGAPGAERSRLAFPQRYLEKLVNIEVPVPTLDEDSAARLLELGEASSEQPNRDERLAKVVLDGSRRLARMAAPVVLAAIAVVAGLRIGTSLASVDAERPGAGDSGTTTVTETTVADTGAAEGAPEVTAETGRAEGATAGDRSFAIAPQGPIADLHVAAPRTEGLVWLVLAGAGLLVLVAGAALRRRDVIEPDSPTFRMSLRFWRPLYGRSAVGGTAVEQTPRAIKRFVNRVRFAAMRLRSGRPEQAWSVRLLGRLIGATRRRLGGTAEPGAEAGTDERDRMDEDLLVGLSAIHEVQPGWLRDEEFWQAPIAFLLDRLEAGELPRELERPLRLATTKPNDAPEPLLALRDPAGIARYREQFVAILGSAMVR